MPSRGVRVRAFVDESDESFHNYSITQNLFDYIRKVLPAGGTILELGSGWATGELAKYYTMYSVEHAEEWLDKYDSTYLHVPLKEHKKMANHLSTLWYDADILREKIKGIKYDLILIDGPPHTRSGFYKYFNHNALFDSSAIMVFDDAHRFIDKAVINSVASKLNVPYIIYCSDDGKPFGVVNDPILNNKDCYEATNREWESEGEVQG